MTILLIEKRDAAIATSPIPGEAAPSAARLELMRGNPRAQVVRHAKRSLVARRTPSASSFVRKVKDFRGFGKPTEVEVLDGIPYLTNEFWTARQRQSHPIHEISYRGAFKAELPEFFISRLTSEGDTVFDPFMGRGTTPIQSALMRRKPIGNDINPLATLLTRPRLHQVVPRQRLRHRFEVVI